MKMSDKFSFGGLIISNTLHSIPSTPHPMCSLCSMAKCFHFFSINSNHSHPYSMLIFVLGWHGGTGDLQHIWDMTHIEGVQCQTMKGGYQSLWIKFETPELAHEYLEKLLQVFPETRLAKSNLRIQNQGSGVLHV